MDINFILQALGIQPEDVRKRHCSHQVVPADRILLSDSTNMPRRRQRLRTRRAKRNRYWMGIITLSLLSL